MRFLQIALWLLPVFPLHAEEIQREIAVTGKYLNLPVSNSSERQRMTLEVEGTKVREFVIRLSDKDPDYWVFTDVSAWTGKTMIVRYTREGKGWEAIHVADKIAGADNLYRENARPQFHFTTRRGWNNDPNGLVFYQGEYHLFYQHNPYETQWQNMHWGHAVSRDLLHWEELSDVLYPDALGMMFSGSAVIDSDNTSGFQSGKEKALIVIYTADSPDREVQCIAYSNDRGRTFSKYQGNPVLDSKARWNSRDTRDPKVFWYGESGHWVMTLFEKLGHSIYTSNDLKTWTYQSHTDGFWECPELFSLPVDGKASNCKWVMSGASGTYLIGAFDGHTFRPETNKLAYFSGSMYAAQTFNNIPASNGRRIQIGWGRIEQTGMPFNQMMTFPTELSLRSTGEGIRLFSEPIHEIRQLHKKSHAWRDLTIAEANEKLKTVQGDLFHVCLKVQFVSGTRFALSWKGNPLADYDLNSNRLNGVFYGGDRLDRLTMSLELLLDRTSVEIFADRGKFSLIAPLKAAKSQEGLSFDKNGSAVKIENLEVHELHSVWFETCGPQPKSNGNRIQ